jgi:hypothetical protein
MDTLLLDRLVGGFEDVVEGLNPAELVGVVPPL